MPRPPDRSWLTGDADAAEPVRAPDQFSRARPRDRSAAVNADCIKLTSYFGERHRANGTFVADALVDLYSRHQIAASIVLRGIQGFGLKRHLRTDTSLSLSEDLPLTAIAVDARPNIEAVLNQTLELNRPGLVTLERARLLSEKIEPVGITENADEATKRSCRPGPSGRPPRSPWYPVSAAFAWCSPWSRRPRTMT
jgi:PII-like signaling protein